MGLVEGGRLLTIPTDRVGAYSRFDGESNKYGKMVSVVPCKWLIKCNTKIWKKH